MNEGIENRLRADMRTVESAMVPAREAVDALVSRVERRLARRRRASAATGVLAAVAIAGAVVWNTSSTPQRITAADSVPISTSSDSIAPPTSAAISTGPWSPIPSFAKPITGATVVWTGSEALMIGGLYPDGRTQAGIFAYNPTTSQWRIVSPDLAVGDDPLAFWTGTSLVLLGSNEQIAATYDPSVGLRSTTPTIGKAFFYVDATVPWVWTGTDLLVWPTAFQVSPAPPPIAFDPFTGESRPLAEIPLESRANAASIWTGSEWIVWGGSRGTTSFNDGAAYDPTTDTWRVLADSPLSARSAPAVWTGTEMIVTAGYGGDSGSPYALGDGAAYDPTTDTWRAIAPGPAHPGFTPVWTGELLILFAKGGAIWYDPDIDRWATGEFVWGDVAHLDHSPVWTGEVVLLLGSYDGSTGGATFTPPAAQ